MSDLFGNIASSQPALNFPAQLTERYRPRKLDQFVGLDKPKRICAKLASTPFDSAWLFIGPSGTGKTTMAMGHSTRHSSRLDRDSFRDSEPHAFGSEEYSREELVAEFTAAFLCAEVGLSSERLESNHTAYIQSWLKALKK